MQSIKLEGFYRLEIPLTNCRKIDNSRLSAKETAQRIKEFKQ